MDPTPGFEMAQDDRQNMPNPMSTLVYEGRESKSKDGPTGRKSKRIKPEMRQAAERVRELYASGVPFFTKGAIADLARQLDSAKRHHEQGEASVQMFSLQGLDGKTVQVENEIGTAWPEEENESIEEVMDDFVIDYQPYQHLLAVILDRRRFSPEFAYCPLGVLYHARMRDKTTNKFLEEPRGLSFEAAQGAFDAGVKAWEGSEECKRITAALLASTIPDKITKVIAFACCTVSSHEANDHSIIQHALMLTVKQILQEKNRTADVDIGCYAQDPVYTDVDRAVLEGAGIRVLDDPHGFLEVNDSSVVIAFSPNVPVRQIVADVARPAIMVWNKVKREEEMSESWSELWRERNFESVEELEGSICDPESSRLREMVQNEYVEVQELKGGAFGDSCIYVRNSL